MGVVHRPAEYFEAGQTPGSELIEVWVDGARRPQCVRAHAGQGWAVSYSLGFDGRVLHDGRGRPREIVERGRVELRRVNQEPWDRRGRWVG